MVVGEPSREELERIEAFVMARVLLGHPVHPVGCPCLPCNMVVTPTTGQCGTCGKPVDVHILMNRARPECPA
jgi:hypothetical protein